VHHGDGGGRSRPNAVRAAWIVRNVGVVINRASFGGLVFDAVRYMRRRARVPRYLRRPTLRALRAGKAFVETAPTSDVSMVIPRAPRKNGFQPLRSSPSPPCGACSVFTRRTKPAARGPRKGYMLPRAETPFVVFGHAPRKRGHGLLRGGAGVFRCEAWRTDSPCLHRRSRQRSAAYFGLDTAVSRRVPSP